VKFIDEIKQQPDALRTLSRIYSNNHTPSTELEEKIMKGGFKEFIFTGMGSSYFAGHVSCALLNKNGIKAHAYEIKEFASFAINTINEHTLLFIISQSGSSEETLRLCEILPHTNTSVIITNNENAPLSSYANIKFFLHAGHEYTTSTKTYTNTIATVLHISNIVLKCFNKDVFDFCKLTNECSDIMQQIIDKGADNITRFFSDAQYICLVGGGASYCTVSHSELLVEEVAKMYSTRYLPAQFLHGPVEFIDEAFCAIIFDFSEETRIETERVIDNILTYGGKVCVITNRDINNNNPRFLSVKLDIVNEYYAPLVEVMPVELFVNQIALERGLSPGILTRIRK